MIGAAVVLSKIIGGLVAIVVGCFAGDLLYRGLRALRFRFIPKPTIVDDED